MVVGDVDRDHLLGAVLRGDGAQLLGDLLAAPEDGPPPHPWRGLVGQRGQEVLGALGRRDRDRPPLAQEVEGHAPARRDAARGSLVLGGDRPHGHRDARALVLVFVLGKALAVQARSLCAA